MNGNFKKYDNAKIEKFGEYAKKIGKELDYKGYCRGYLVFLEKDDIIRKIDLEKIYLKSLLLETKDYDCEMEIESIKSNNQISGVCDERVLPYLILEDELVELDWISFTFDIDNNRLLIINRHMGIQGRFFNNNEVRDFGDISKKVVENLTNLYSNVDIEFEKAGKSNIFKLKSPLFLGIGRTAILLKNIYYLISDTENLCVLDKE